MLGEEWKPERIYVPGTNDSLLVQQRQRERQARESREANRPTGTELSRTAVETRQARNNIDEMSIRIAALEAASNGLGQTSSVLSSAVTGFGLTSGTGWRVLTSLKVSAVAGMRVLLGMSVTGLMVSHGASPLRVRLCVSGRQVAVSAAAYADDTKLMPGASGGLHSIGVMAYTEAMSDDLVTCEAMSSRASDWPSDKENVLNLTMRVDFRPTGRGKES
jgi:hypothetical protein